MPDNLQWTDCAVTPIQEVMGADFRQMFCQRFQLAPEQFEERLFSMCLFRHSVPAVHLLRRWKPEMFREDYDLVRDLATTRCRGEVVTELNRFFGRNRRVGGFWRNFCLCRVSGKRVLQLYRGLMHEAEEAAEETSSDEEPATPSFAHSIPVSSGQNRSSQCTGVPASQAQ